MTQATKGHGPGTALQETAKPAGLTPYDEARAQALDADAGVGFNDATQNDRTTPFLGLVQGLSPQIDKNHARFIKGAEIGDIFNVLTGELWKPDEGGARVILVKFEPLWIKWVPLKQGGGFIGSYRDEACTQEVFVPPRDEEPSAFELVKTLQHAVLIESHDGAWLPAILPMKRTQERPSREWMTLAMIMQTKYPTPSGRPSSLFARIWKLTSVQKRNKADQPYMNFKVEDAGPVLTDDPESLKTYMLASMFRKALDKGLVKADYSKAAEDGETGTGEEKSDLPF